MRFEYPVASPNIKQTEFSVLELSQTQRSNSESTPVSLQIKSTPQVSTTAEIAEIQHPGLDSQKLLDAIPENSQQVLALQPDESLAVQTAMDITSGIIQDEGMPKVRLQYELSQDDTQDVDEKLFKKPVPITDLQQVIPITSDTQPLSVSEQQCLNLSQTDEDILLLKTGPKISSPILIDRDDQISVKTLSPKVNMSEDIVPEKKEERQVSDANSNQGPENENLNLFSTVDPSESNLNTVSSGNLDPALSKVPKSFEIRESPPKEVDQLNKSQIPSSPQSVNQSLKETAKGDQATKITDTISKTLMSPSNSQTLTTDVNTVVGTEADARDLELEDEIVAEKPDNHKTKVIDSPKNKENIQTDNTVKSAGPKRKKVKTPKTSSTKRKRHSVETDIAAVLKDLHTTTEDEEEIQITSRTTRCKKLAKYADSDSSTEADDSMDTDFCVEKKSLTKGNIKPKKMDQQSNTSGTTPTLAKMKTTPANFKRQSITPTHRGIVKRNTLENSSVASPIKELFSDQPRNKSRYDHTMSGARVWAYLDGFYYPAIVNSRIGNSEDIMITFEDGMDSLTKLSSLRPFDLSPGDKCLRLFDNQTHPVQIQNVNETDGTILTCDGLRLSLKHICTDDQLISENISPKYSSRLFKGFAFVLAVSKTNDDGTPIESAWCDKSFLQSRIENIGGHVLISPSDHYNGRKKTSDAHPITLLLANRPLRTKKYLMALALGIPIVSVKWLEDCIKENRVLEMDAYRLSNGYSLEIGHWACSKYSGKGIFENVRIYMHEKENITDWKELLNSASCQLVVKADNRIVECDYVFCNEPTAEDIQTINRRATGQIVTSEVMMLDSSG